MTAVRGLKGFAVGLAACALALGMGAQAARASLLTDPALFFVSNSPTSFCSSITVGQGCVPYNNNEANQVASNQAYLDFNSDGSSHSVGAPIILLMGIPVGPNFPSPVAPNISSTSVLSTTDGSVLSGKSVSFVNPGSSSSYYNGGWDSSGLLPGFDNTYKGSAYDYAGLQNANGSESFGNWQDTTYALDCTFGMLSYCGSSAASTTLSYTLAVYELFPDFVFQPGQSIGITFGSEAIDGSMLVAYGCAYGQPNTSVCSPGGKVYATPFTQAGATWRVPVPEPMSLSLFGTGLLGLGLMIRRRKRAA